MTPETSDKHDYFMTAVANPSFSVGDLQSVGLTPENTKLEERDFYKLKEFIRNTFTNPETQLFDEKAFNDYYNAASQAYNYFVQDTELKAMLSQIEYDPFDFAAPEKLRKNYNKPGEEIEIIKINNPYRVSGSMTLFGIEEQRTRSIDEIAQTQQIYDPETNTWSDSPNDESWWGSLGKVRVMAQWDFDADAQGNPTSDPSKVVFHKGERKLNDNGTFYYEELAGRDIYGRQVLNKLNTLTVDGTALNKFDFFDLDDMEEKSMVGTALKNTVTIGSMFIPYVGPVIATASMLNNLSGMLATLGKFAVGSDSPILSHIEGLSASWNRQLARTEYAQQNPWCMENMISVTFDFLAQMREQRVLFEWAPMAVMGNKMGKSWNWGFSDDAMKAYQDKLLKRYLDDFTKPIMQWMSNSAKLSTPPKAKIATVTGKPFDAYVEVGELQIAKKAAQAKAMNEFTRYQQKYHKIGETLSKAYMAGLMSLMMYHDMKHQGVDDTSAAVFTGIRFMAEMALLSTPFGNFFLPEMRAGENLALKSIIKSLMKKPLSAEAKAAGEKAQYNSYVEAFLHDVKPGEMPSITATRVEKMNFIQKVANYFKTMPDRAAHSLVAENWRDAFKASIATGIEGGLVNDAEEMLNDLTKAGYNLMQWLKGDENYINTFNLFDPDTGKMLWDRYGIAFFSGIIGGLTNGLYDNYNATKQYKITDFETARQLLIYLARNNKLGDLVKRLDKMTLASPTLGLTYDPNTGGFVTANNYKESLDYFCKKIIKDEIAQIESFLSNNGGKFADKSILNTHTDLIRDVKLGMLAETQSFARSIQDFNSVLSDMLALQGRIDALEKKTVPNEGINPDGSPMTDQQKVAQKKEGLGEALLSVNEAAELTRLKQQLKDKKQWLEDFKVGKKSVDYLAAALVESSPIYNAGMIPVEFSTYCEMMLPGKKFADLTKQEVEEMRQKYDVYVKTEKGDAALAYSKLFLNILQQKGGDIQAASELIVESLRNEKLLKISNTLGNFRTNVYNTYAAVLEHEWRRNHPNEEYVAPSIDLISNVSFQNILSTLQGTEDYNRVVNEFTRGMLLSMSEALPDGHPAKQRLAEVKALADQLALTASALQLKYAAADKATALDAAIQNDVDSFSALQSRMQEVDQLIQDNLSSDIANISEIIPYLKAFGSIAAYDAAIKALLKHQQELQDPTEISNILSNIDTLATDKASFEAKLLAAKDVFNALLPTVQQAIDNFETVHRTENIYALTDALIPAITAYNNLLESVFKATGESYPIFLEVLKAQDMDKMFNDLTQYQEALDQDILNTRETAIEETERAQLQALQIRLWDLLPKHPHAFANTFYGNVFAGGVGIKNYIINSRNTIETLLLTLNSDMQNKSIEAFIENFLSIVNMYLEQKFCDSQTKAMLMSVASQMLMLLNARISKILDYDRQYLQDNHEFTENERGQAIEEINKKAFNEFWTQFSEKLNIAINGVQDTYNERIKNVTADHVEQLLPLLEAATSVTYTSEQVEEFKNNPKTFLLLFREKAAAESIRNLFLEKTYTALSDGEGNPVTNERAYPEYNEFYNWLAEQCEGDFDADARWDSLLTLPLHITLSKLFNELPPEFTLGGIKFKLVDDGTGSGQRIYNAFDSSGYALGDPINLFWSTILDGAGLSADGQALLDKSYAQWAAMNKARNTETEYPFDRPTPKYEVGELVVDRDGMTILEPTPEAKISYSEELLQLVQDIQASAYEFAQLEEFREAAVFAKDNFNPRKPHLFFAILTMDHFRATPLRGVNLLQGVKGLLQNLMFDSLEIATGNELTRLKTSPIVQFVKTKHDSYYEDPLYILARWEYQSFVRGDRTDGGLAMDSIVQYIQEFADPSTDTSLWALSDKSFNLTLKDNIFEYSLEELAKKQQSDAIIAVAQTQAAQLDSAREALGLLMDSPLIQIVDSFTQHEDYANGKTVNDLLLTLESIMVGNTPVKAVKEFVQDPLSLNFLGKKNLQGFTVADMFNYMQGLKKTMTIIRAALVAATRDDLSGAKMNCFTNTLNEVAKKVGTKNWQELISIDATSGIAMINDLIKLEETIAYYENLFDWNSKEKYKLLRKEGANAELIFLNKNKEFLGLVIRHLKDNGDDEMAEDLDHFVGAAQAKIKPFLDNFWDPDPLARNVDFSDNQLKELELAAISLRDAWYEFFQQYNTVDHFKKIFNAATLPLLGKLNVNTTMSALAETMSDNNFLSTLLTYAAMKNSDFQHYLKEASQENDLYIPLLSLESAIAGSVAMFVNPQIFDTAKKALWQQAHATAKDAIANNDAEAQKAFMPAKLLKTLLGDGHWDDTTGVKWDAIPITEEADKIHFLLDQYALPMFSNTFFTGGIPGVGKTDAIARFGVSIASKILGRAPKILFLSGINKEQAAAGTRYGAQDDNCKYFVDHLREISTDYKDDMPKGRMLHDSAISKISIDNARYLVDPETGKKSAVYTLDNTSEQYDLIIFDEVTFGSRAEVDMLDKYAKSKGAVVWALGDSNQSGVSAEEAKGKNATHFYQSVETLEPEYFFGNAKMGTSMRTGNTLVLANNSALLRWAELCQTVPKPTEKAVLRHKIDALGVHGHVIRTYSQDYISVLQRINDSLTDQDKANAESNPPILLISNQAKESTAFTYAKNLFGKNAKVLQNKNPQGLEAKYVVVDWGTNVTSPALVRSIYTHLTRGIEGTLVMHDTNINVNIEEASQEDAYSVLESVPPEVKQLFVSFRKALWDALPAGGKITKVTSKSETTKVQKPAPTVQQTPIEITVNNNYQSEIDTYHRAAMMAALNASGMQKKALQEAMKDASLPGNIQAGQTFWVIADGENFYEAYAITDAKIDPATKVATFTLVKTTKDSSGQVVNDTIHYTGQQLNEFLNKKVLDHPNAIPILYSETFDPQEYDAWKEKVATALPKDINDPNAIYTADEVVDILVKLNNLPAFKSTIDKIVESLNIELATARSKALEKIEEPDTNNVDESDGFEERDYEMDINDDNDDLIIYSDSVNGKLQCYTNSSFYSGVHVDTSYNIKQSANSAGRIDGFNGILKLIKEYEEFTEEGKSIMQNLARNLGVEITDANKQFFQCYAFAFTLRNDVFNTIDTEELPEKVAEVLRLFFGDKAAESSAIKTRFAYISTLMYNTDELKGMVEPLEAVVKKLSTEEAAPTENEVPTKKNSRRRKNADETQSSEQKTQDHKYELDKLYAFGRDNLETVIGDRPGNLISNTRAPKKSIDLFIAIDGVDVLELACFNLRSPLSLIKEMVADPDVSGWATGWNKDLNTALDNKTVIVTLTNIQKLIDNLLQDLAIASNEILRKKLQYIRKQCHLYAYLQSFLIPLNSLNLKGANKGAYVVNSPRQNVHDNVKYLPSPTAINKVKEKGARISKVYMATNQGSQQTVTVLNSSGDEVVNSATGKAHSIRHNCPFILYTTDTDLLSAEYDDAALWNQYVSLLENPDSPKKVSLIYVRTPKKSFEDYIRHVWDYVKGKNRAGYMLGTDFSSYAVLNNIALLTWNNTLLEAIMADYTKVEGVKEGFILPIIAFVKEVQAELSNGKTLSDILNTQILIGSGKHKKQMSRAQYSQRLLCRLMTLTEDLSAKHDLDDQVLKRILVVMDQCMPGKNYVRIRSLHKNGNKLVDYMPLMEVKVDGEDGEALYQMGGEDLTIDGKIDSPMMVFDMEESLAPLFETDKFGTQYSHKEVEMKDYPGRFFILSGTPFGQFIHRKFAANTTVKGVETPRDVVVKLFPNDSVPTEILNILDENPNMEDFAEFAKLINKDTNYMATVTVRGDNLQLSISEKPIIKTLGATYALQAVSSAKSGGKHVYVVMENGLPFLDLDSKYIILHRKSESMYKLEQTTDVSPYALVHTLSSTDLEILYPLITLNSDSDISNMDSDAKKDELLKILKLTKEDAKKISLKIGKQAFDYERALSIAKALNRLQEIGVSKENTILNLFLALDAFAAPLSKWQGASDLAQSVLEQFNAIWGDRVADDAALKTIRDHIQELITKEAPTPKSKTFDEVITSDKHKELLTKMLGIFNLPLTAEGINLFIEKASLEFENKDSGALALFTDLYTKEHDKMLNAIIKKLDAQDNLKPLALSLQNLKQLYFKARPKKVDKPVKTETKDTKLETMKEIKEWLQQRLSMNPGSFAQEFLIERLKGNDRRTVLEGMMQNQKKTYDMKMVEEALEQVLAELDNPTPTGSSVGVDAFKLSIFEKLSLLPFEFVDSLKNKPLARINRSIKIYIEGLYGHPEALDTLTAILQEIQQFLEKNPEKDEKPDQSCKLRL